MGVSISLHFYRPNASIVFAQLSDSVFDVIQ